MSGFSNIFATRIANWLRGTNMPDAPTSLRVALSTTELNDAGTNLSEPSSSAGYMRQTMTFGAPVTVEGVGARIKNASPVIFGPATEAWSTVHSVAVLSESGEVLLVGNLAAPRAAPKGDTLSYGIGALEFTIK